MKTWFAGALLLCSLLQLPSLAHAEEIIMTRSVLAFPEAMLALQESIRAHGYTVSRVQRIDIGLTGMGYKTDKYRVVFAGKLEEIRQLTDKAPELTAYLPPKISIFAEGEQTVLVTLNPQLYAEIAGDAIDPIIFTHWESDLRSIFRDVNVAR
ncbi:MAG: DUF302 domain-containing protein [Gammaproteobacteria bacterium]|nr:DUF302 domain-containing protein [Gammaproteobacteria bacterium]MDH3887501.1 DUF302 domain-containing protein [Gammaproteobacteria bacterium]MDH3933629.1 DUF302 domain-containing protein [Gammaproteobacteria bacterium]MDH3985059.1 DUF302 domain-containing protein [Gammaproteobacteria bacterium]